MSFLNLPPPTSGGAEGDADTGIPNIHIVPIAGGAGSEVPGESSPGGLRVQSFPLQNPRILSRSPELLRSPHSLRRITGPRARCGAMAVLSERSSLMQGGWNWL